MIAGFFVSALIFMGVGWFTLRRRYAKAASPTRFQSLKRLLAFTIGVPFFSVLLAFMIFHPQSAPSSGGAHRIAAKSTPAVHHEIYNLASPPLQIVKGQTTADEVNDVIGSYAKLDVKTVNPDPEMPGSLVTLMPYDFDNELLILRFQRRTESGPYVVADITTFQH